MLSVLSVYSEDSLVEHIVETFEAPGVDIHLWALERPLPTVARWTRGSGRAPKFQCLNQLLGACQPSDVLLFTDDDIRFSPGFVDGYLNTLRVLQLDLAQPALTVDSFHAHHATLQRDWLVARRPNRVEQMVWSMSARLLQHVAPFPDLGSTAWAQEYLWARAADAQGWRMGIVDAYPVSHNIRPVGSAYSLRAAHREMMPALSRYGIAREPIRTVAVYAPDHGIFSLAADFKRAIQAIELPRVHRVMDELDTYLTHADERYRQLLERIPRPCQHYLQLALYLLDRAAQAGNEHAKATQAHVCAAPVETLVRFTLEAMDMVTRMASETYFRRLGPREAETRAQAV
jgi:hypothetical protein